MKFSHNLKFNSVPEWRQHYMNYGALKKLSYQIEQQEEKQRQQLDTDMRRASLSLDRRLSGAVDFGTPRPSFTQPLLRQSLDADAFRTPPQHPPFAHTPPSMRLSVVERGIDEGTREVSQADFRAGLEQELRRVSRFFVDKQAELAKQLEATQQDVLAAGFLPASRGAAADVEPGVGPRAAPAPGKESLEEALTHLYVQLTDLLAFLDMNATGFRKILKKHDKVTNVSMMDDFMPLVTEKLSQKHRDDLATMVGRVVDLHSSAVNGGDRTLSESQLRKKLREHLVWERDTIWRDMVALERRAATARLEAEAPVGGLCAAWWKAYQQPLLLCASLALFAFLLRLPIWRHQPAKRHCAAMLGLLVALWTSEALPLYVTSMLVPLLTVVLRILPDPHGGGDDAHPGGQLPAPAAAEAVFKVMFSQVIVLLLGGFAIAAALSKHNIAKAFAANVLARVGSRPRDVILANMFVATFASMWISNVAAPVLCFSLIQPILRTLPSHNSLSKCLVMGIALASNVGGMTSPISSPQNIFAIERMAEDGEPPSWLSWFVVALPVSIVCNLLIWWLLLVVYRPGDAAREVRSLRAMHEPIKKEQVFVLVVSGGTVALWCANTVIAPWLGSQGIVALVPLALFFGTGILGKDDFNNFLWHVVMLAQGGLVLGAAVRGSGLLADIATFISAGTRGMSVWGVTATFCALVLVCTTFISHTVGAMVILPIVQTVGERMLPTPHPRLLVMAAALMCSGAMGLPISGFPNMNAVSLEDSTGKTYVTTTDFLKVGILGSVIALVVVLTLGYALMSAVGF